MPADSSKPRRISASSMPEAVPTATMSSPMMTLLARPVLLHLRAPTVRYQLVV